MIDPKTGMVDWMVPDPGPPERQYPQRNTMEFYIPHDMVGYYRGPGSYTAMRDPARQASWPITYGHDPTGRPTAWQHYPVWASCWTSGSREWNTKAVAPETNRVRPQLAMPDYVEGDLLEMHVRFIRDLEEFTGREYKRSLGTIKEHREVAPPSGATACPNGRFVKLYEALEKGDDELSAEDRKFLHELGARVTQLEANIWPLQKAVGGNGYTVDGETLTNWDAINALHQRGISLAQFMANLNAAVIEMRKGGNKDFDPRVTEKLQEIVDIMEGK